MITIQRILPLIVLAAMAMHGCSSDEKTPQITEVIEGPTITGVSPSTGPTEGGTEITLSGTLFSPGATVHFGSEPSPVVTFVSSTVLKAEAPAHAAGTVDVMLTNPNGQSVTLTSAFTYNAPPTLSYSLAADSLLWVGESITFTVTATDPEGDLVSLKLINPPPNCIMTPIQSAASPATATVNFLVPSGWGGYRQFLFQTRDSAMPGRRTHSSLPVQIVGDVSSSGIVIADVTGDGILDTIGKSQADVFSSYNAGAIYVWAGTTSPSSTPTAFLTVPWPTTGDSLGFIESGQGILCVDVTGDGILDIVAGASWADVGGVEDTGAIYVWAGGSSLTGSIQPTATLAVSQAVVGDRLCNVAVAQGILCSDVTGDGILDIVAGAYAASVGGVGNTGAIYVWAGGSTLAGNVQPTATLTVSGAAASDLLCLICHFVSGHGQGLLCADVTGDGTLDIVAGAKNADGTFSDTGAIYVWAGGSTLTGDVQPTATLTVSGAALDDQLCRVKEGQGILFADVTGDGTLDIVAMAQFADGTFSDTGAVYVWAGGSTLTGDVQPTATLTVSGAVASERLGFISSGRGMLCADVTGDGTLDIVAGAVYADGTLSNTGAIYVWAGGSTLTGSVQPTATLTVSTAAASDQLCNVNVGQGIFCVDVTGDGTLDIVAGAAYADGAFSDTGAIYVWAGGPALTGGVQPTATLTVAGAVASDRLGDISTGQGILCADVTGDGTLDIVAGAYLADRGAVVDTGAVYVWAGGSSLSGGVQPTATLTVSWAATDDRLGFVGSGQGILCADVSGDGTLDIVVGACSVDIWGWTVDAGGVYVWAGGSTLTGAVQPTAVLQYAGSDNNNMLGFVDQGQGILCVDITGDGILDIVAGAKDTDVQHIANTGAIHLWAGGPNLKGGSQFTDGPKPTSTLAVPGATADDQLGYVSSGQGIYCADVSGDGALDIVAGAFRADVGGETDTGAIYVWIVNQFAEFSVPWASDGDYLGN